MRHSLALVLAVCASSPLFAQQNEVAVYGGIPTTGPWEVRRLVDTDNDGMTMLGEDWQFAEDGEVLVTFIEDLRYGDYDGTAALYTPAGGDFILRMQDDDDDGVAMSAGEVYVWADTRAQVGVGNTSPDGVQWGPLSGGLYVTDDNWSGVPQPGAGIQFYIDTNADGDANDVGEFTQFVDGTQTVDVQGTSGTLAMCITDIEDLMVDSNEVVIGWEQQTCTLIAFQDLNGDGDAMDAGEAWNFLNLIGDVTGLEQNADVVSGALPNPSCTRTSTSGCNLSANLFWGDLGGLAISHGAGPLGEDIYWIGAIASNSGCNGGNGWVFRGIDANGDGDLNDAGEVTVWIDGANNAFILYPITSIWDLDADGETVVMWQENGPNGAADKQDSVWRLEDMNGDGDAEDAGEQVLLYGWEPDGCFAVTVCTVPFGAFWLPDVASFEPFGMSGTTSAGQNPVLDNIGLPEIGGSFQVTLTNAETLNDNTATLHMGFSNTTWSGFSLPLDLTAFGATPNNFLYVSLDQEFSTTVTPSGDASITFNVPNNAALDGRVAYFQWAVDDSFVSPLGLTMSNAGRAEVH